MDNFWNERYAVIEYVYGTEPNSFFKEQLNNLCPNKLLLPAEGEGRNAVYAAKLGWKVTAFDTSIKGKEKALTLAQMHNIEIEYLNQGYKDFYSDNDKFDAIALIYAHMSPEMRPNIHKKLLNYLKPGGTIILEGFSKDQLKYKSGGPGNIDMLFSEKEILNDFNSLQTQKIATTTIDLNEGQFHKGKASVLRYVGKK